MANSINITTKIASVDKIVASISNSVDKANEKAYGLNKPIHVAPGKMPTHVGVEHGVRPPKKSY